MIPDASELRPTGITKTIFHCPACRAEAARLAKVEKPPEQQSRDRQNPPATERSGSPGVRLDRGGT